MTRFELAERPLRSPDQDRLGVKGHAARLAEMLKDVELPFTLGVYGPWGAGKTTFANLVVHNLRQYEEWKDARWLEFSAWPYVTAEGVWRALLQELAATVFDCKREKPGPETGEAWRSRLRSMMLAEALTLYPEPQDTDEAKYERLIARLDRAGGVANRTPGSVTSATITGIAMDVAATLAPGLSPLRHLFGSDDSAAAGPDGEAPHGPRSIEDLREDLEDLFDHDAGGRIIVLLDDLDRCRPEVALDVLETIKIFVFDRLERTNGDEATEPKKKRAQLLFIVAADERLVAQGMRARLGAANPEDARAYLEKIMQLGVELPDVEAEGAHELVAAWEPEWSAAADLIVTALDGNPRRMKQQCKLLSYRFSSLEEKRAHEQTPTEDGKGTREERRRLRRALDKLTRLRTLCPDALPLVVTRDADALQELLSEHPEARKVHDAEPSLDDVDPLTLSVLAAVADVRPGAGGIPLADDRVFAHIAALVAEQLSTTTLDRLHGAYLQTVLAVCDELPDFAVQLRALAKRPQAYADAAGQFDDWLDSATGDASTLGADAQRLVKACRPVLDDERARGGEEPLRTLLTQPPRLSQIPPQHVATVKTKQVDEYRAEKRATRPGAGHRDARKTTTRMLRSRPRRQLLDKVVAPRLDVANDVVERRKFVKLYLLQTRWPELADLGRSPIVEKRLREIEKLVRGTDPEVQLAEQYRSLAADERLQALLSVPPYLDQMLATDYAGLIPQRPAVVTEPEAAPESDQPSSSYVDVELKVEPSGEQVRLKLVEGERETPATVTVPLEELEAQLSRLTQLYSSTGSGPISRAVRAATLSADDVLGDLGSSLWAATIGADAGLREHFMEVVSENERVRLLVTTDVPGLAGVPWECLYIPSQRVFAGLSLKLSIVRAVTNPAKTPLVRTGRPLRVLAVLASPVDMALPGAEQEIAILRQTLEPMDAATVHLETIEAATHEALQRALRTFAPHVFHFVGHGFVRDGEGYLALVDSNGRIAAISARAVGVMLREQGILLAVLNGCATGATETEDLAGGVAQTLVAQGVPAAVSTTRTILDDMALRFATEFYRALTDGFAPEACLVEGRKALAVRSWDWSAYVMYGAAGTRLEDLHTPAVRATS